MPLWAAQPQKRRRKKRVVDTGDNFDRGIPILPNRTSKYATAATLRIDLHYANLGIITRWNWERFIKLCIATNHTPAEVASAIALPHWQLHRCEYQDRFSGPACMLLTILEAKVMKAYSSDIIPDPFKFDDPPKSP